MKINIFKKDRTEWIDLARGWAIVLVVFAHTPIPTRLSSYIYSFHVPLFFIISGFLLRSGLTKSPADFIKNKVMRLAVPYLFFSAIGYAYWLLARHIGWDHDAAAISAATPMNGTIMAIRNSVFMTHNSALWFICSLFVSEILFYAIYKIVKGDKTLLIATTTAVAALGIVYNTFNGAALPWAADTAPIVLVFLGFGYFVSEYYPKWKKVRTQRPFFRWLGLLALALLSLSCWWLNKTAPGTVDMYYGIYGNFALYFLGAFSGSLVVLLIFESFILKSKALTYIGANSLIIYALHQKVIFGLIGVVLVAILGRAYPLVVHGNVERIANGLTYLAITLLVAIPTIYVLTRYWAPFIGRGKKKEKIPESIE